MTRISKPKPGTCSKRRLHGFKNAAFRSPQSAKNYFSVILRIDIYRPRVHPLQHAGTDASEGVSNYVAARVVFVSQVSRHVSCCAVHGGI